MNTSNRNNPGNAAREAPPTDEIRSRSKDRPAANVGSPGDSSSRECVDAGNEDIARERDLLQSAIDREVNDVIEHGQ